MSLPILEVQSISKKFKLHHERKPYVTLRESMTSVFKPKLNMDEDFWVLKDISFELEAGQSLGIVGRNGAGKSTLLKILSRISPPTSGKIISRGRIASLLEVGTGFHMELTGRENIFMNGSLLGMRRREIKAKFDEIVDFAGVERFLDTPLKHYSSGMQLRLAFSVAAHLEPEVLIIDEVLAVGDAGFQRKCIGKMEEISDHGRTILFVSHNFSAVQSLCRSCIYLKNGSIASQGTPQDVIQDYLKDISENKPNAKGRLNIGDEVARLINVRVCDIEGRIVHWVDYSNSFRIEFDYEILSDGYYPTPNIHLTNVQSEKVFVAIMPKSQVPISKGKYTASVVVPSFLLNPNSYIVSAALTSFETMKVHFHESESINFNVEEDINLRPHDYRQAIPGIIRPDLKWL